MDVPPIHVPIEPAGHAALAAIARRALVLDERRQLLAAAVAALDAVVGLDGEQLHAALDRGAMPLTVAPGEAALLTEAAELVACATARYAREEQVRRAALHDPLTGLANRMLLEDRLAGMLAARRGVRHPVAVLYLDLDGFKAINDSAGHATGDELLRHLARRMAGAAGAGDVVARIGGDEFVVVTAGRSPEAVHALAERLAAALTRPVVLRGRAHRVGASIGVALASEGEDDTPASLVARADAAMYAAKREPRADTLTPRWTPVADAAQAA